MNEVLDISGDATLFEIDALTAATSGDLTTLAYQCQMLDKEGLILGFYGSIGMLKVLFFKVMPIRTY